MANPNITPESLAAKTFAVTILAAVLYISVVFMFVIGGNRREEAHMKPSDYEHAGAPVHGVHQDQDSRSAQ